MKKFIAGMTKDPERVDQPDGTYRDALNANLYYQKGAVVNEQGTTAFTNVGGFSITNIIGQCALKDGRIVLFFNYELNGAITSAISIVDPADKTNDIIYRNAALNFKPSNTIEATSKTDVNGETLVYFTDNYMQKTVEANTGIEYISDYNPPRVLNITRQQKSSNFTRLYSNPDYTVEKLDLFLNAGFVPEFRDIKIEEGGGVVSGTYHLALAYVDEDLNRTNYLVTSNPVHVVTEHEDAIPTETITGDPQGSQSNKSISWIVDIPIPSNYTHVRPVIIQRFGGGINQESSEFAYELDIVQIPEGTNSEQFVNLEITYTGLEQASAASISEVVIDSVRYETAKSFVQLDNRLYISNLRARGDIGYQRFANNIKVIPTNTQVRKFDPKRFKASVLNSGYTNAFDTYKQLQKDDLNDSFFASNVRKGYKDVRMSHKYRGYRRSEVYAFYISFVLKDGSETYAYHIPGREEQLIDRINKYETASISDAGNALQDLGLDVSEFQDLYPDSKIYQITDSQYLLDEGSTDMSYWENEDELYPDTEDFSVWSVNSAGDPVDLGLHLGNTNIRHHKMPPNKNDNFTFIGLEGAGNSTQVSPSLFNESSETTTGFELKESINILGVTFTDIAIPTFIESQVQGFKIYYAKRSQQEKTIIGQSVVVPSWYEDEIALGNRMSNAAHGPYLDAWFLRGLLPTYFSRYHQIPGDQIPNYNSSSGNKRVIGAFTFHDFNMLKNKHTLSGASHIDVQKVLNMRMWAGGPKKKAGNNAPYMLDGDWINPTIGNTQWYEWTDEGEQSVHGDPDDTTANPAGVANYWTSIWIAQRYYNPNYVNTSSTQWSTDQIESAPYFLNNYQTIFTLALNSKTYITGSTLLNNTDSSAFKDVDYLMHFAGESCMAFGLSSGLPVLIEERSFTSTNGYVEWWQDAKWKTATGSVNSTTVGLDLEEVNVTNSSGSKIYGGWPTMFLVNLCSYKTNVYKPFDQQKLVWTGYYQAVDSTDRPVSSATRAKGPQEPTYKTETVFGGDTYVGRYSFRTTSQDWGAVFFKGGSEIDNSSNWATSSWQAVTGAGVQSVPPFYRAVDPWATVYNFFCESDDLLGFRHQGDNTEGVSVGESMFFDGSIGADVLFNGPNNDNTKSENLLYMNNYSAVQDVKVTAPLPKKLFNPTFYPTRTIRSTVDDGSIQDKYRFFLALDYKDIPRNRGAITKAFTLGSILYLHTERSLFVTRGRQQLGLSDNTQAFVGSGDIFEQNPDELIPTTEGYGGSDCQFASLTTRFGQFFVNRRDRKVYMMSENIEELSSVGMEKWFLDNIPYQLESYIDLGDDINFDSPTGNFGFNATYDPKYKRIILSKRELIPIGTFLVTLTGGYTINVDSVTNDAITISGNFPALGGKATFSFSDTNNFRASGWTISYYPEIKVWGSRHSYLPNLFANNQREYYGLTNTGPTNVWEHSNFASPGNFYNTQYNFEFEFIDNTEVASPKIFTALRYWLEVVEPTGIGQSSVLYKHTSPGFDAFYVYNSTQISGDGTDPINYLSNARLVNNFWYINQFRDKSTYELNTSTVLANGELNVQDDFNQGSTTTLFNTSMFTEEGIVNGDYINANKSWYNQKRFVDHYLGIRLINNNLDGNLIYLYSAGTKFRQSFR